MKTTLALALAFAWALAFIACSSYGEGDATTPPDASVNQDAGTDVQSDAPGGGGDADAGPLPCPDGGFCDSFERTGVVGSWNGVTNNMEGCKLEIDNMFANEGKSSLKLSLVEKTTDSCQAYLSRQFANASPKKMTVSFDFRVPETVDREVQIASITLADPDRVLVLMLIQGALRLAEQNFGTSVFNSYPVGGVEPGQWHHVELVHEISTRVSTVNMTGAANVAAITASSFAGTGFTIWLGTNFTRAGGAGEVYFDDYRFLAE